MFKKCSVESCDKNVQAKNLCSKHYQSLISTGSSVVEKINKKCSVNLCDRGSGHLRRGLCQTHYARLKRTGSVDLPEKPSVCQEQSCSRSDKLTRGLCQKHYERYRRGDPTSVAYVSSNHKNWKSGQSKRSTGYVSVYTPKTHPHIQMATRSGHIMEHRLVMAVHIGRDLFSWESVHHINGVRDDNRIENLELWSTSQPAGQRVVDKLRWAKEIIELYEGII